MILESGLLKLMLFKKKQEEKKRELLARKKKKKQKNSLRGRKARITAAGRKKSENYCREEKASFDR